MTFQPDQISIGVLYLIRLGDPLNRLQRFLDSLPKNEPRDVKIYVLIKTCGDVNFFNEVRRMVQKSKYSLSLTEINDEGFDLGAYFLFSKTIEEPLVLPMSSSSQFAQDIDFTKLILQFENPKIGLIGAMASRESARSCLINARKEWVEERFKITNFRPIQRIIILISIFARKKARQIFRSFPEFPNTHIRTTGFVIRRHLLQEVIERVPKDKFETLILESGKKSIYQKLLKRGFQSKLYINGRIIDPESRAAEDTFRSPNSEPPFVFDHWWDHFHKTPLEVKSSLIEVTWGRR